MTAVLLTVAMAVWAQNVVSGTATGMNGRATIAYTFSGGEVKKKEVLHNRYANNKQHVYECDILEGEVINLSASIVSVPEGLKEVTVYHSFDHSFTRKMIIEKADHSINFQYTATSADVGGMTTDVSVYLTGELYILRIKWHVIRKPNTTTTPMNPEATPGPMKGTMERLGMKMEYSCSNGVVTKKNEPVLNDTLMIVYISGEIKAGETLKVSCKGTIDDMVYKANEDWNNHYEKRLYIPVQRIRYWALSGGSEPKAKEIKGKDPVTQSITVPQNVSAIRVDVEYSIFTGYAHMVLRCQMRWDVVKRYAAPDAKKNGTYKDVAADNVCPECKGKFSGYYIGDNTTPDNENYIVCENGGKKRSIKQYFNPIYLNDKVVTGRRTATIARFGNLHWYSNFYIQWNTEVLCKKKPYYFTFNNTRRKIDGTHLYVKGGLGYSGADDEVVEELRPDGLDGTGKFVIHLANCTLEPLGTAFVARENGNTSEAYLLHGSLKATYASDKTYTLKPGQASLIDKEGKIKVKKIDVNKVAQEYGVRLPGSTTTTSSVGQTFTASNISFRILSAKTVEIIGVRGTSKTIKIPAQVKHSSKTYSVVGIAKNAFANQTQLTTINIPKTVRAIAEDAFLNTGLTQVTISGDKVSIVKNAFRDCKKLTLATVNGKEPQCSPDAFNGCSAMKELRIKGISESNNGKKLNGTNAVIKVIK